MTTNRMTDLLDAIDPNWGVGSLDMLLCATIPRPISDYRPNESVPMSFTPALNEDEVAELMRKTLPLGRYGAQARNIIRRYYPDARLPR